MRKWLITAIFFYLLSALFQGIQIDGIFTAIVASAVFGIVNAILKPIIVFLSIPVTFLTLGFFYLVINALMLIVTANVVPGFHIAGFGTAFWAAIVLSFLNSVILDKKD